MFVFLDIKRQINIRLSWRISVVIEVENELISHSQVLGLEKGLVFM